MGLALIMKPPIKVDAIEKEERAKTDRLLYDFNFNGTVVQFSATAGDEVTISTTLANPLGIDRSLKIVDADGDTAIATANLNAGEGLIKLTGYFIEPDAESTNLYLQFSQYDGTNYTAYCFHYVVASLKWQYLNSGGTYIDITNGGITTYKNMWHKFEIVIDTVNKTYKRFIIDNNDLTSIKDVSGYPQASATKPYSVISFTDKCTASTNHPVYVCLLKYFDKVTL